MARPCLLSTRAEAPLHTLLVEGYHAELTQEHHTAIEQALPLLGFVLAHERELQEAERRMATELVDAVLFRRTHFATGRLEAYGLDPRGSFVGIVMMVDKPPSVLSPAKRVLDSLADDAVVAAWQDTVTAIVQPERQEFDAEELGRSLHAALGPESAVGIGA